MKKKQNTHTHTHTHTYIYMQARTHDIQFQKQTHTEHIIVHQFDQQLNAHSVTYAFTKLEHNTLQDKNVISHQIHITTATLYALLT